MTDRRPTLDTLRSQLHQAGLRATSARMAVLKCLAKAQTPVTHAEVYEQVAEVGIDRATVYRNLMDLAEAGLLRRNDLGDRVWRFERVADHGELEGAHPHFVCTDCGTVACLPIASVQLRAVRDAPQALRHQDLEIQLRGRCDACTDGM